MTRALFLAVLFFITSPSLAVEALPAVSPVVAAPEIGLMDLDGKKWSLSDLKGRPVIINFWATWCPPCIEEMPSIERAWNIIKDEGIQVLAISYGEDQDLVEAFIDRYPMSFPVIADTSGNVVRQWPVKGLPTTVVLNSAGEIVYQVVGTREWDDAEILEKIRALK